MESKDIQESRKQDKQIPYCYLSDQDPDKWHSFVILSLKELGINGAVVVRFFPDNRLENAIIYRTDRKFDDGQDKTLADGPSFTQTKKNYDHERAIMEQKKISPEQVTWAFSVNSLESDSLPNIPLSEGTALLIYDKEKLEELSDSFFAFKGTAKDVAVLIVGHKPIEE